MNDRIKRLRIVGVLEGISFLVLLFVAMPLKYMYGFPIATKIVGMTHGILFLLFCFALYDASRNEGWIYRFRTLAFISSLLPFGTFFLERRLRKPEPIPTR